jgi:lipoate-protein ligase A
MPTECIASPDLRVLPYALPDASLLADRGSGYRALAWIPAEPAVVLGCSSQAGRAVEEAKVLHDGIPVYRRPSGGESMFLSPRMAAVSLVLDSGSHVSPRALFNATGALLIRALESLGVMGPSMSGTSDLALGGRKLLGSAIYQRGTRLFYHAVLNVAEDPATIQRYLRHPVREPQYRQGRSHDAFVTSLVRAGFQVSPEDCREALAAAFEVSPLPG